MMKKILALVICLTLLLGIVAIPAAAAEVCTWGEECPSAAFVDLGADTWYHDEVDAMLSLKFMKGISAKEFDPNGSLTRAMFVTILYRIEEEPAATGQTAFADVDTDTWYTKAVLWAESQGLVTGYNEKTFAPNDPITREQMATVLYRYSELKHFDAEATAALDTFADEDKISSWAKDAMKWAVAKELFQGDLMKALNPGEPAKRCEAAAVFIRFGRTVYVYYDTLVETSEDLPQALAAGGQIMIAENVELDTAITLTKDTHIILLEDLDASAIESDRPFHLAEGVTLSINAEGKTIKLGDYGLVNVPGTVKEASIHLNGGTYVGETDNGALIRLRNGNETIDVTLNDVSYEDPNGYAISGDGFSGDAWIHVNGGSFKSKVGIATGGANTNVTVSGATFTTAGVAFESSEGTILVEDSTVTVDPGIMVSTAPSAAFAASNGGSITARNCTISGRMHAAYEVYTTGGSVFAEGNDLSGATFNNDTGNYYYYYPSGNEAHITVDGIAIV